MKRNAFLSRVIILALAVLVPAAMEARKSTYNQLEHHDFIYLAPAVGYYSLMDATESAALDANMTKGVPLVLTHKLMGSATPIA